ncbi:hypothetical protein ONE63_011220 [Megalurothrips usitatus]|uniref:Cytochrome P450 4C1-like n=1 Tax=Megalurothrips usitatus TaxID=439358 RepID=A0AAV7X0K9_9NEOP|nr:hypothetical protein ONE63_011220 [Megalurothrips usitatus]
MSPVLLFLVTLLVSLLVVRGLRLYARTVWRWHTLSKNIPGPPAFPIIGAALTVAKHPDKLFRQMQWLWTTYGSTIRLWLGPYLYVILTEPDDVEVFCTSAALADKPHQYASMLAPVLGRGLITINNPQHRAHRKVISTSMHLDILKGFVNVFGCRSQELVGKLRRHAERGEVFNMSPYLGFCVNHSLCETVLSTDMAGVEKDRDELIRVADQASWIMFFRLFRPWYWSNRLFALLSSRYKVYASVVHGMQSFVHKVFNIKMELIRKGVRPEAKRLAFLDHVLASDARTVLTEEEIKEELRTLIWAGSTTTTDSLGFFFIAMSMLPDVQSKIHEELDSVFGEDRTRPVDFDDLPHLQYLERCIKEGLRMFPPVCCFARAVSEDVTLPSGHVLPKDTVAVTVPYAVHRDQKWFPDPEKFDPDRFLPENCTGRHPFTYIPFSAGSRNCVGQRYAMMSMKAMTASVLRHFTVLPDPDGPTGLHDIPITIGLSMVPTHGARVLLVPRRTTTDRTAGA